MKTPYLLGAIVGLFVFGAAVAWAARPADRFELVPAVPGLWMKLDRMNGQIELCRLQSSETASPEEVGAFVRCEPQSTSDDLWRARAESPVEDIPEPPPGFKLDLPNP